MRNALLPLFLLFNVSLAKREACLALLNQELMSRSIELHCIPVMAFSSTNLFLDRILSGMRLPWECHDQLQETNCRHCVTGLELAFFHKRKAIL